MIKKKTTSKKVPPKKKTTKTAPKKKTTSAAAKKPEKVEPSITILQTAKCDSVSGKALLTYNVGIDDEGRVYFRVNGSTGGGHFSREWIAFDDIKAKISCPDI